MENRELSMHEKPKTQNYTHLAPLSVNTLKKHMFGLEDILRGIVKQRLSGQKLGFAVDVSYYKGSADGYVDSGEVPRLQEQHRQASRWKATVAYTW
ncbi:hypothetical protein PF008_g19533 [Phytophthora fragariae]|uniref:Uncharacterized protein n=1 Tax=Phytophthora fragariae TaxID=53985 RepID=A0A6G0R248_9STRA|nr:hypothetical protein PF008_g19533 [Phytophthora fragariae]